MSKNTKSPDQDSTYKILEDKAQKALDDQKARDAEQAQKSSSELRIRPSTRLTSLDAFRGFIMIMLAANGFGIAALSRLPDDASTWEMVNHEKVDSIAFHFTHPAWQSSFVPGTRDPAIGSPWLHWGVSFWDLIQPAFMFMVGVAIPYSFGRKAVFGISQRKTYFFAFLRSIALVLMGVFLYSLWTTSTHWIFPNVLAQIGLGYFFVTLLVRQQKWIQYVALSVVLVGSWIGIHVYHPESEIDPASVSSSTEKGEIYLSPYRQWSKNLNSFHAFDVWFLNLFPRAEELGKFEFNSGGYQTLNFVPAMGTMILGLLCGELLLSARSPRRKFGILMLAAFICLFLGVAAGATCCPIVKRIWTPSWVLFSGGYVIGMLALFYLVFDVLPFKKLAFPLTVVGMNSILVYFIGELGRDWIIQNVNRHFEWAIVGVLGMFDGTFQFVRKSGIPSEENGQELYDAFFPVVDAVSMAIVVWLICYWLYRQRVFVRI